ncbi:MAG: PDZ domain-containing protein, partial [Gammaproteobacteria bacterium]|nr:PDZ domain-containing protein [Gammaproteobacteria bacterium]
MKTKVFALCLALANPFALADELPPNRALTLEDLRTFTDVFDQVRNHFVEPRDEHALLMAAIEGMVSTLDPWSEFMTPDEFREFDNTAAGRYGGIGVNIGIRNRRLVVDHVNPLGPAFRNGVKTGDLILAVDDVPVKGRRLSESMDALLGEAGTVVRVEVMTPGEESRQLEFEREYLDVASVFSAIREGVGLVRISHFTRQSDEELKKV